MKILRFLLPTGILVLAIVAAVVIINAKDDVTPEPIEQTPQQVRVMTVKKQPVQMIIHSQGTVQAKTESEIVAQVSGVITSVSPAFVAGGFFKKGDILVSLDSRDYEYRLTQAKHQVTQAELALKMEEQQAEIAVEEWRSMNQGAPPALVSRQPQMADAKAALESARASLAQASLDLERTQVTAPFDGRVRAKNVDIGRYVTPGMSLATIYSTDIAEVRLPLPDQNLAYLGMPLDGRQSAQKNVPVILTAEFAGGLHKWQGRLTRFEGEVDPRSRMIHAVAQVDHPYSLKNESPLTMGLFVKAQIIGKKVDDLIVLPRVALREPKQVLVVDNQSRLHLQPVTVYRSKKDSIYVSAGLKDGDMVCLSQPKAFVDGMSVAPAPDDGFAAR